MTILYMGSYKTGIQALRETASRYSYDLRIKPSIVFAFAAAISTWSLSRSLLSIWMPRAFYISVNARSVTLLLFVIL